MFAQSLLDYAFLSNFVSAMESLANAVLASLGEVSQSTWVIIGLLFLLILVGWARFR